jgi:hypothetical protein
MSMFSLGYTIILMGVRTRDIMRYAKGVKERFKLLILTTPM